MTLAPKPRLRLQHGPGSYSRMFIYLLGRDGTENSGTKATAALSSYVGSPHVVLTPMCRTGIYLVLSELIEPGQEVILSPYTIADVVNMVICAGGIPVFADIEKATCNISCEQVRALITDRTGAVLITHLHGIAADTPALKELCAEHAVYLIEDVAQAFGAEQKGRKLGTIGDAGVYSFGMYKNVNTWYGGAVCTPHADIADRIRARLAAGPLQNKLFLLNRLIKGLVTDLVTSTPLFQFLSFHKS